MRLSYQGPLPEVVGFLLLPQYSMMAFFAADVHHLPSLAVSTNPPPSLSCERYPSKAYRGFEAVP
ncbi:hypothetical protein ACT3S8_06840 [Halomonas sp. AOP42-D2-25]|uniref:hypothetical protein n=1 Tax=Halomonas sp. AOP42-D2-25 TaxID=3457666 RepID=UPI0040349051